MLFVNQDRPTLMGKNWLQHLRLNWKEIKSIRQCDKKNLSMKDILEKYKNEFETGIGKLKDIKGKLTLQDGTRSTFCNDREVAFALRPRIKEKLNS